MDGKQKELTTKHKFNELWAEFEGTKKVWKLQATNGILTFNTKKKAVAFQKAIEVTND